ncbi:prepilin-type N-terminal cleavage/methylation domain-containing protein [Patescibacteria group bacterium]|nr:prepilin-type N-terminal cleavage/methylation domain-containing protein [Patescibacteria group bacterium]
MHKSAFGFTLIELLIVISIMVTVGVFSLANYESFGEDQKLKSAVLDVQSILRNAQTNATTNVECDTEHSATWQVEFADTETINLKCQKPLDSSILIKGSKLDANIGIDAVYGVLSVDCPSVPPPSFTISFAPLDGKITLGETDCKLLTITFTNINTNTTKSLIIEQGGRIYAQ